MNGTAFFPCTICESQCGRHVLQRNELWKQQLLRSVPCLQGPTDSCTENTGYTFSSFSCGHGNASDSASDSASSQAGANTANGAATMEQAVDEMFTAAVAVAAPKAVNAEVCAFSTTGATGDTSSCAMLLPRGSTLHW